jgi:hypothetical protein
MLKAAIEKILSLGQPVIMDVDGRSYLSAPGEFELVREPIPTPITTETLTGLTDYLERGIDGTVKTPGVFLHVGDFRMVALFSPLSDTMSRSAFITAMVEEFEEEAHSVWTPVEDFIINIQNCFAPSDDRTAVLQVVSNLASVTEKTAEDDGISQTVRVRAGIQRTTDVAIRNPVVLKPWCTFPEIEPPEREYVFRIRKAGDSFNCMLSEGVDNRWKLETAQRIAVWLKTKLAEAELDVPVIV